MTRDEAVSYIQMLLGFRTDQAANIIKALKAEQVNLEKSPTKPWFLISEEATILTVDGEVRIPLPSDFLQELDESQIYYVPADSAGPNDKTALFKGDNDDLQVNYKESDEGPPEAYSIDGKYFRVFPVPDRDYTIKMRYYKQDDLLTTNIENKWLLHVPYLLIGAAGKIIAAALRDANGIKTFTNLENTGRILLFSQNEARVHANQTYQMGGPH